jgi:hypothetical protein
MGALQQDRHRRDHNPEPHIKDLAESTEPPRLSRFSERSTCTHDISSEVTEVARKAKSWSEAPHGAHLRIVPNRQAGNHTANARDTSPRKANGGTGHHVHMAHLKLRSARIRPPLMPLQKPCPHIAAGNRAPRIRWASATCLVSPDVDATKHLGYNAATG